MDVGIVCCLLRGLQDTQIHHVTKRKADIYNVKVDDTHIKLTVRLIKWLNSEFFAQICFMFDSEQTQSCVIVFNYFFQK
jgi:hypothetical protein